MDDVSILQILESGDYLNGNFPKFPENHVLTRIEQFTKWFNSQAKLYFLNSDSEENEAFVYLLLSLSENIKHALTIIKKTQNNWNRAYTCRICDKKVLWSHQENHEHFEDINNLDLQKPITEPSIIATGPQTEVQSLNSFKFNFNIVPECESAAARSQEPPQNNLNNFKFNFVINYNEKIAESLYPESMSAMTRKVDKIPEFTVQRCGPHKGYCLLCSCSFSSKNKNFKLNAYVLKNHVLGQRHLRNASCELSVAALKKYHDFWRGQDPSYQAHQVYFATELSTLQVLRCHLCSEFVPYMIILEHINGVKHKTKIIKMLEAKQNEFYLVEMQVAVYNITVPSAIKKSSPKTERSVNNNNATTQKKCVIKKCTIQDSGYYLPDRYSEHRKFLSYSENRILCSCCGSGISDILRVKWHVLSPEHRLKSNVKPSEYEFYCEICNSVFSDEFAWADHFTNGPNRHNSIAPSRKNLLSEYECETCLTVIYGDELSLTRHRTSAIQKNGNNKPEITLPITVKKLFRAKAFIEEEGGRLKTEATQVLENQDKMRECCEDLQNILAPLYPKCRAYPFGSRVSGLGNNQSDLDVYMDTGDMYLGDKNQDPKAQKTFVEKATKLIKSQKDTFNNVLAIPAARTPIIKLQHCYTKLDCDVSFRHGLGVENTKFLRYCMELQPITQPFILLLKKWSNYCGLNEHITNYGLSIMAIFYLQISGFLPSVHTIRTLNPRPSLIIDGWDTINYSVPVPAMKKFVRPYPSTLKQVLREFFFYYSVFDYNNNVICPLLGRLISKMQFCENPGSLPPEMRSYVQRIETDGELFRANSPFCIQDPFDLSHNLTKACQHGIVKKLKTLCKLSYEFLDSVQ